MESSSSSLGAEQDTVLEGLVNITSHRGRVLSGDEWTDRLSWRRYFRRAWQILSKGRTFVTWDTQPVPDQLDESGAVVFVWPVSFGCFSPYTQPTDEYQLFADRGLFAVAVYMPKA